MIPTRALTCWQPWATLLVAGYKAVENRGRPIPRTVALPVRILVHAANRYDISLNNRLSTPTFGQGADWPVRRALEQLCAREGWDDVLEAALWLPYRAVVGEVTLTGSHAAHRCHTIRADPYEDHARGRTYCSPWAEPDLHHWQVADPVEYDDPIDTAGAQGLWIPDADLLARSLAARSPA